MKIDIVQGMHGAGHAPSVQKNEDSNKEGFGKILEDTLKGNAVIRGQEKHTPMREMMAIEDVQRVSIPADNEIPVYESTNRLLDVLDEYRGMLADQRIPAENIQPVVDKLSYQSERLSTGLRSLSEESLLKPIANHALIVSSLEVMKFGRGDYGAT